MAYAHVGHDCLIGDEVVITNLAQLAGHVTVERKVVVSGMVGCTQFVRLGELSFLTAGTLVNKDVAPYSIAVGILARGEPRRATACWIRRQRNKKYKSRIANSYEQLFHNGRSDKKNC